MLEEQRERTNLAGGAARFDLETHFHDSAGNWCGSQVCDIRIVDAVLCCRGTGTDGFPSVCQPSSGTAKKNNVRGPSPPLIVEEIPVVLDMPVNRSLPVPTVDVHG